MATVKAGKANRLVWIGATVVALLALWLAFGSAATGYANAATAYSARVACSCRYVAGRPLEDCAKDKIGGMELVTLSEDPDDKSVTARMLLFSDTARMKPGYGCVLDPWNG
ncbi:hypothetical protein A6F68_00383 [Tsuneonella dongtanensis]|uniref:Uncharacterized protein n=1 Tax=Tsuneonella dongtanensis TaxID=692370 RepID=A0A1B2AA14_9SPHN|nr:hypothetical protein [Tsuneonella dongtanensis]ANY18918.1 hypothetical protein A6F68_00383 [Tsuneonella dongtanensis]